MESTFSLLSFAQQYPRQSCIHQSGGPYTCQGLLILHLCVPAFVRAAHTVSICQGPRDPCALAKAQAALVL